MPRSLPRPLRAAVIGESVPHALCLSLFCLLFTLTCWTTPVWAQEAASAVPTIDYQGAAVPDWSQIGFDSLPAMISGGSIQFPGNITRSIGYNPSRVWQAGDSVSEVLKLGDVADGFGFQNLNLNQISQLANLDLNNVSLGGFDLAKAQTLDGLVQLIPSLGDHRLADVAPIASLVQQYIAGQGGGMGEFSQLGQLPISQVIGQGQLGSLQLGDLQNINSFSLTSIPDLDKLQLGQFEGWQNQTISQVPGLGSVSFSEVVGALNTYYGFVARHDMTYGGDTEHKESTRTSTVRSISGSYQDGFNVECVQSRGCDYLELESPFPMGGGFLGNLLSMHGARWIRGGTGNGEQMVNGGEGALSVVNGGKEPTGRHPFGKVFKVVLINTDESSGSGMFGLYFRYCQRYPIDLGCTPYVIGPVPIFPTHEKGLVLVGFTNQPVPGGATSPAIPDDIQEQIDQVTGGNNGDNETCAIDPQMLTGVSGRILGSMDGGEAARASRYMPQILQACSAAGINDPNQLAYVMATAEHETDYFRTTDEYSRTMYDECGWGEGLIQVTLCSNKRQVFQRLGLPAYGGMNDRRLHDPTIAAQALCRGMKEGWYTGVSLGQCISGSSTNLACARSVVNGDYGRVGAGIDEKYERFRRALTGNGSSPSNGSSVTVCQSTGGTAGGGGNGTFARPVGGQYPVPAGGEFHNDRGTHLHQGVDFSAPIGTPIGAAEAGTVVDTCIGCNPEGYGSLIVVRHANGLETRYAHVNTIDVRVGQQVTRGQRIGTVGNRGRSTGPHLHFEVRRNGQAIDPMPFLQNRRSSTP